MVSKSNLSLISLKPVRNENIYKRTISCKHHGDLKKPHLLKLVRNNQYIVILFET